MNPQYEAAWEMHLFLTAQRVPYALIGGMALPRWAEPRATLDVDLMVLVPLGEGASGFVQLVTAHFPSRVPEPLPFARRARVVLLRASNNVPVDISLGLPGYEEEVIRRAVEMELEVGKSVRVCSAEDLLIHKAVAGRPQDLRDLEAIVIRQAESLDTRYVRFWLRRFADLAENPEILGCFERAWRSIRRALRLSTRRTSPRVPRRKRD